MQIVFDHARSMLERASTWPLIEVVLNKAQQHFLVQPQWPVLHLPALIGAELGVPSNQQEALGLINLLLFCYADITDDAEDHDLPSGWKWGWEQAVNVGNTLLFACFQQIAAIQATESQRLALLSLYAKAGFQMTLGQAYDLRNAFPDRITQGEYMEALRGKTGGSLAVFASSPAVLADAPYAIINALWEYGENLGTFIQFISDVRDSKTDLRNGCLSLPLMYLLDSLPEQERQQLEDELRRAREGGPYSVSGWLERPEIRLYVEIKAEVLRQRARKALDVFDESSSLRQGLEAILSLPVYHSVPPLL